MSLALEALREGGWSRRFSLKSKALLRLGAAPEAELSLPEEPCLSGVHAELRVQNGALSLRKTAEAANAIFVKGKEAAEALLVPGDFFVIGSTRFKVLGAAPPPQPAPGNDLALPEHLRLMNLLELPEILRLKSTDESLAHLAGMLRLVTAADWVEITSASGHRARDASQDNSPMPAPPASLLEEARASSPKPCFQSEASGAWSIA
jgi:hypothetical protein